MNGYFSLNFLRSVVTCDSTAEVYRTSLPSFRAPSISASRLNAGPCAAGEAAAPGIGGAAWAAGEAAGWAGAAGLAASAGFDSAFGAAVGLGAAAGVQAAASKP